VVFVIAIIWAVKGSPKVELVVRDFLDGARIENLIENFQKEIRNPGALIGKIDAPETVLTKAGVMAFTNRERRNAGLTVFLADAELDRVALERARDMFAKGYFEHVSPSGESASTVAEDIEYEYITIGENIALGNFADDETLVQAWMDSPGHKANILHNKFTHLGVAAEKGLYNGKQTWISVQIFSRPMSECPAVSASLRATIQTNTDELDQLRVRIDVLKSELEEMKGDRGSRDEYNAKVEEHNALAKEINEKVSALKSQIATYNQEVKTYNSCVGE
jgi:hypothetical protein